MPVNPQTFHGMNMIDASSVWNLLSSNTLYRRALSNGCVFSCTSFVMYECLHKPRSHYSEGDTELQKRLTNERMAGLFKSYSLALEDLQEVEILERRKRLSKGELSSIAFAKRTGQAFLTDDQRAQRLALEVMPGLVQTIPHLFGWLLFQGMLKDSERAIVIAEYEEAGLPFRECFDEAYLVVQQYRSFSGK